MINFAYPSALWFLFLPLLAYVVLPKAAQMYGEALKVPFAADIAQINAQTGRGLYAPAGRHLSFGRFLVAVLMWLCVVAALCRPQWVGEPLRAKNNGRDILLVVDISTSMNEPDFAYQGRRFDRLTAVKNVVSQFVDRRVEDKIGLVLFGTRAYMQVPLTYDRQALKNVLLATDAGMAGDSTAIGDAIGVALKNLAAEDNKPENKVIVLLTDGENNDGKLSLAQAINLAKQEKIKVYTIGVGSDEASFFGGLFRVPVNSGLDEESLQQLADETKGTYFRAKDLSSLLQVYDAIDKLEPEAQEGRFVQETRELFYYPAAAALLMFVLLMLLTRKGR